MWFKNLRLYRLAPSYEWSSHQLQVLLAKEQFNSASDTSGISCGWVAPFEQDALLAQPRLAYALDGQVLCTYRTERKLLPASVIAQFTKAKVAEIREQQGFTPGRKQTKEIKEQVIATLLPRAFSLGTQTRVWIDPKRRWLAMDTASPSKAEEVLSALGKALHPFPVLPLRISISPVIAMTNWILTGQVPGKFSIDQDAEMRDASEKNSVVRYVKHDLHGEAFMLHVKDGKQCTRLALTWDDKISFVLTDNLDIKRISAVGVIDQSLKNVSKEEISKFESDFTLMSEEFNALLNDLVEVLGGEDVSDEIASSVQATKVKKLSVRETAKTPEYS